MRSASSHSRLFTWLLPFFLMAALLSSSAMLFADEAEPWAGEWQVFSRGGQFIMNLNQSGNEVTGKIEPGGGSIEALVEGRLLKGRWARSNASGAIQLALSADGETLTGRFDNSEYLNGQRIVETSDLATQFSAAFSPRETLRTVVTSMNEAFLNANPAAIRFFMPLFIFEQVEEETSLSDASYQTKRLSAFWRLLNLSTFRIFEAPLTSETNETFFSIGPDGSDVSYDLLFRYDEDDRWKMVVETLGELDVVIDRMLDDLGYETYEDFEIASKRSPRATMQAFLNGTKNWRLGGQEAALAKLDLSFLPEHLQRVEGPILADYLLQIIDRAGFVVPQEIPNDPNKTTPYIHYTHPLGSIVIERVAGEEEGEAERWLFSAETLQSAPVLFNAIQDMPLAEGLGEVEPLTDFFRTREAIRAFSPTLLERDFVLENWQWIALALALIIAVLLAWGISRLVVKTIVRFAGKEAKHGIKWPARIFIAGFLLQFVSGRLAIAQSGLGVFGQAIAVLTMIGLALLLYRMVGLIGAFFVRRAEGTVGYFDEIVASLATGIAKLIVVVVSIFVCADLVGLPYEGVITGLGVGGVALAFASARYRVEHARRHAVDGGQAVQAR